MINLSATFALLTALRQGGTATGKALHKPVLLLALLEKLESGDGDVESTIMTSDFQFRFKQIWKMLIPHVQVGDFFKPIFHLQNDGFFEVFNMEDQRMTHFVGRWGHPFVKDLIWCRFTGPLTSLLSHVEGIQLARMVLLDHYFPNTKHKYLMEVHQDDLIANTEAAMLLHEPEPRYVQRTILQLYEGFIRDHKFRTLVLQSYRHTCCMTGLKAEFLGNYPLLDAAHIEQHASSGIDTLSNGLALCKNMHAAFDNGMVSLSENYHILVSPRIKEQPSVYGLKTLAGQKILLPDDPRLFPSPERLAGHRDRWGLK